MASKQDNSVIVRGGGLKGSSDPKRNTCPMKLGKGSTSSPDRHRVKTGNIYQEYKSINRFEGDGKNKNNYNFRPKVTKAVCYEYKGSRHDLRPNKRNIINSFSSESRILGQGDFDEFNAKMPIFSCGKCKKHFNDRHSHSIDSPNCIKHDTLC